MLTKHVIEHAQGTLSSKEWAAESGTVPKPLTRGLYVQIGA